MTEIHSLDLVSAPDVDLPDFVRGGVITIGNFDGVHQGHAALLQQANALAAKQGVSTVAIVLDPHPSTILRPKFPQSKLTTIQRRAELMASFRRRCARLL